jgi:cobalt/nickel transport system permease protein
MAYCSAKVRSGLGDGKAPLMGVLGAFVFAAQMINFSIPATGSSGHLGGGLLLAILLGPHAAFLTLVSVLLVQALFFADGGLLALGCNIFNLGFFPAFIAYPLIYRKIIGNHTQGQRRMTLAAVAAAVVGLQLGAFGVVMETSLSDISSLPFGIFLLFMQPIHLAIGLVEGFATAAVVSYVHRARPEILYGVFETRPSSASPARNLLVAFLIAALMTGSVVSWFASKHPDGLEWSIAKVTGSESVPAQEQGIHTVFASLQEKLAILPDYGFKKHADAGNEEQPYPHLGTSVSGFVGGMMTLAIALLCGVLLKKRRGTASHSSG